MELLNASQILEHLVISRATFYRLMKEGMPYHLVGRRKMFDLTEVERFLQRRKNSFTDVEFQVDQAYTDEDIAKQLDCELKGSVRCSRTQNAMAVIASLSPQDYEQYAFWNGDILYYTVNETNDLKELISANDNRSIIYVFDRYGLSEGKNYYRGTAVLQDAILPENTDDGQKKQIRLRLSSHQCVDEHLLQKIEQEETDSLQSITTDELIRAARRPKKTNILWVKTEQCIVESRIKLFVHMRSEGHCELCGAEAPFVYRGGSYLEECYIIPPQEGGNDSINNVAAVCPNCHQKLKKIGTMEDRQKLKAIVEQHNAQYLYKNYVEYTLKAELNQNTQNK